MRLLLAALACLALSVSVKGKPAAVVQDAEAYQPKSGS